MNKRLSWFIILMMALGYLFLYGPIVSLVVFSFNQSKLVTVWGGFSTQWYGALLNDDQVITAFFLSLKIAILSSTVATILGTMAAAVECECDGNVPVTADDVRGKIDTVERQML